MSVVRRSDGAGPKTYVPRDRYSLMMSFCVVPESFDGSTPCSSAATSYIANSHMAVALIVIDVFMVSSGMSLNS